MLKGHLSNITLIPIFSILTIAGLVGFSMAGEGGLVAPEITFPVDESRINDSTPDFAGTGTDGSFVRVFTSGTILLLASTTANDGWAAQSVVTLEDGPYMVFSSATLSGSSKTGGTISFTIDTDPPELTGSEIISPTQIRFTFDEPVTGAGTDFSILCDGTDWYLWGRVVGNTVPSLADQ